ncbi:hypothetical protein BDZ97DRAFT_1406295 [Flammula alnicola]|nr:hypothetical protein BDZ97DRAFT_1406295 [Flammula alnicola]
MVGPKSSKLSQSHLTDSELLDHAMRLLQRPLFLIFCLFVASIGKIKPVSRNTKALLSLGRSVNVHHFRYSPSNHKDRVLAGAPTATLQAP